jgi:hypothetical protein
MNYKFLFLIVLGMLLCFQMPISGQETTLSENAVAPSENGSPSLTGTPYPESILISLKSRAKHDASLYHLKRIGKQQHFEITIFTPVNFYHYFQIQKQANLSKGDFFVRPIDSDIKSIDHIPFFDIYDLMCRDNQIYPMVILYVSPTFKKNKHKQLSYGRISAGSPASAPREGKSEWYTQELQIDDIALYIDGVARPEVSKSFKIIPIMLPRNRKFSNSPGIVGGIRENEASEIDDEMKGGFIVVSPDLFAPKNDICPVISIKVKSEEYSNKKEVIFIPEKSIRRIWMDFEPLRNQ